MKSILAYTLVLLSFLVNPASGIALESEDKEILHNEIRHLKLLVAEFKQNGQHEKARQAFEELSQLQKKLFPTMPPKPDFMDPKEKIKHMEQAVRHLHESGEHELAEKLEKEMHARIGKLKPADQEIRESVHQLQDTVHQSQAHLREIAQHLENTQRQVHERLENMAHRLDRLENILRKLDGHSKKSPPVPSEIP